MSSEPIIYTREGRVALITLNRPEKRNALNAAMVRALASAFREAEKDDAARVILLRAAGTVFSAGADLEYLRQLQQNSEEENLADSLQLKDLFLQIHTCPKAVVAQVQGHAIAGGCGLATVCDVVFCSSGALFGYTETKIGFVPALVAPFAILRMGAGKARELLLSGELASAGKAREYGLVNFVEEPEKLEAAARDFAARLAESTSPASVALTKELLSRLPGMNLEEALVLAARTNVRARSSEDFKKGIGAFLDKTTPEW